MRPSRRIRQGAVDREARLSELEGEHTHTRGVLIHADARLSLQPLDFHNDGGLRPNALAKLRGRGGIVNQRLGRDLDGGHQLTPKAPRRLQRHVRRLPHDQGVQTVSIGP